MKTKTTFYLFLYILSLTSLSCEKKEYTLNLKSKYYKSLNSSAQDFHNENHLQKSIIDPDKIFHLVSPKKNIDYSKWISANYKTGDLLTDSQHNPRIFDYNKKNKITIINSENMDAVIYLTTKNSDPTLQRQIGKYYLKSSEKIELDNIPSGDYDLHVSLGNDWKEFEEKIVYSTIAYKQKTTSKSIINHGQFSKNEHSFFKGNIVLTEKSNFKIKIKNSTPTSPLPPPFVGDIIYEDTNGNPIHYSLIDSILKSNPNARLKNIIRDGLLECVIIENQK